MENATPAKMAREEGKGGARPAAEVEAAAGSEALGYTGEDAEADYDEDIKSEDMNLQDWNLRDPLPGWDWEKPEVSGVCAPEILAQAKKAARGNGYASEEWGRALSNRSVESEQTKAEQAVFAAAAYNAVKSDEFALLVASHLAEFGNLVESQDRHLGDSNVFGKHVAQLESHAAFELSARVHARGVKRAAESGMFSRKPEDEQAVYRGLERIADGRMNADGCTGPNYRDHKNDKSVLDEAKSATVGQFGEVLARVASSDSMTSLVERSRLFAAKEMHRFAGVSAEGQTVLEFNKEFESTLENSDDICRDLLSQCKKPDDVDMVLASEDSEDSESSSEKSSKKSVSDVGAGDRASAASESVWVQHPTDLAPVIANSAPGAHPRIIAEAMKIVYEANKDNHPEIADTVGQIENTMLVSVISEIAAKESYAWFVEQLGSATLATDLLQLVILELQMKNEPWQRMEDEIRYETDAKRDFAAVYSGMAAVTGPRMRAMNRELEQLNNSRVNAENEKRRKASRAPLSPMMEAYTRRQAQTEQGQKLDALICDPGRRVPVNQEKVESNAAFATSLAVRHNFGDSPAIWYSRIRMDGSIAPLDLDLVFPWQQANPMQLESSWLFEEDGVGNGSGLIFNAPCYNSRHVLDDFEARTRERWPWLIPTSMKGAKDYEWPAPPVIAQGRGPTHLAGRTYSMRQLASFQRRKTGQTGIWVMDNFIEATYVVECDKRTYEKRLEDMTRQIVRRDKAAGKYRISLGGDKWEWDPAAINIASEAQYLEMENRYSKGKLLKRKMYHPQHTVVKEDKGGNVYPVIHANRANHAVLGIAWKAMNDVGDYGWMGPQLDSTADKCLLFVRRFEEKGDSASIWQQRVDPIYYHNFVRGTCQFSFYHSHCSGHHDMAQTEQQAVVNIARGEATAMLNEELGKELRDPNRRPSAAAMRIPEQRKIDEAKGCVRISIHRHWYPTMDGSERWFFKCAVCEAAQYLQGVKVGDPLENTGIKRLATWSAVRSHCATDEHLANVAALCNSLGCVLDGRGPVPQHMQGNVLLMHLAPFLPKAPKEDLLLCEPGKLPIDAVLHAEDYTRFALGWAWCASRDFRKGMPSQEDMVSAGLLGFIHDYQWRRGLNTRLNVLAHQAFLQSERHWKPGVRPGAADDDQRARVIWRLTVSVPLCNEDLAARWDGHKLQPLEGARPAGQFSFESTSLWNSVDGGLWPVGGVLADRVCAMLGLQGSREHVPGLQDEMHNIVVPADKRSPLLVAIEQLENDSYGQHEGQGYNAELAFHVGRIFPGGSLFEAVAHDEKMSREAVIGDLSGRYIRALLMTGSSITNPEWTRKEVPTDKSLAKLAPSPVGTPRGGKDKQDKKGGKGDGKGNQKPSSKPGSRRYEPYATQDPPLRQDAPPGAGPARTGAHPYDYGSRSSSDGKGPPAVSYDAGPGQPLPSSLPLPGPDSAWSKGPPGQSGSKGVAKDGTKKGSFEDVGKGSFENVGKGSSKPSIIPPPPLPGPGSKLGAPVPPPPPGWTAPGSGSRSGSGKPSAGPGSGLPPPPDRGRGASSSGQAPAVKREFTPVQTNPYAYRLDELRRRHAGWYEGLVKRLVEYKDEWCAAALKDGVEPEQTIDYFIQRTERFAHESEFSDFECPSALYKSVWEKVTPQWWRKNFPWIFRSWIRFAPIPANTEGYAAWEKNKLSFKEYHHFPIQEGYHDLDFRKGKKNQKLYSPELGVAAICSVCSEFLRDKDGNLILRFLDIVVGDQMRNHFTSRAHWLALSRAGVWQECEPCDGDRGGEEPNEHRRWHYKTERANGWAVWALNGSFFTRFTPSVLTDKTTVWDLNWCWTQTTVPYHPEGWYNTGASHGSRAAFQVLWHPYGCLTMFMTEDACWEGGRRTEQDRYQHIMHMLWEHIIRSYVRDQGNEGIALGEKVFRGRHYDLKVRDRIGAFGKFFPEAPTSGVIDFAGISQQTGTAAHLKKRANELFDMVEAESPGSGREPWEAARHFLPAMLDPAEMESVKISKSK